MASKQAPYWSRVHREAFRRARGQVVGAAINITISIAAIVAAISGLWALGSEDAAEDEIIGRLFVASACAMILVIQYLYWMIRIPHEWDEKAQDRIAILEEQLIPQLQFIWMNDTVKEVYGAGSPATIHGKIGQVIIRNRSEFQTARSVEVSLRSYLKEKSGSEIHIDSSIYSDSTEALRSNINPGREESFNLFKVKYGFDKLMLGPFAHRRRNNLEEGKYKIKIIASAEGCRPVEEDCFLSFEGYEIIEFRRWEPRDAQAWSNRA